MNQNGQLEMSDGKIPSPVDPEVAAVAKRLLSGNGSQPALARPPDARAIGTADDDRGPSAAGELRGREQVDDIVGRSELARRLRVNVRTIDRMVRRGEIPGPCIGAGGRPRWLWKYVVDSLREQHERSAKLDRRTQRKLP